MNRTRGFLYRRKGSGVWYAGWNHEGQRYSVSTGKRDRKSAEDKLDDLLAPFRLRDEATMARMLSVTAEHKEAQADAALQSQAPALAPGDAWAAYLASPKRPDTGAATLTMYACQFNRFVGWMAEQHPKITALRDITPRHADAFARWMSREGFAPGTYNKYVNLLTLVWRVLKEEARLAENPWPDIERKRLAPAGRRELTIEELRNVCSQAKGDMRLLLALGLYTGLRLGDSCTLHWGEVDMARRKIVRTPSKIARNPGARPVSIAIHPELFALLAETPPAKRRGPLLPQIAASYARHSGHVCERIQAHFTACGVETAGRKVGIRNSVAVGFHSLRHSFVSLCRAADVPLSVVEAIVGHANPAMTRHYTHTGDEAVEAAVAKLPGLSAEAPARIAPPKVVPAAAVHALAEGMKAGTWRHVRSELLKLVETAT